jgi:hypothetical protein
MEENAYTNLVGKPEGKRRLASRGPRWEDNTKTDLLKKIEWKGLDWSYLTQDMHKGQHLMKTQQWN